VQIHADAPRLKKLIKSDNHGGEGPEAKLKGGDE
jgi:hypothetical protein